MNKRLKTYAVYGMIEWHAQLRSGKAVLNVSFTGGAQTGYGVTPALFSTDSLFKQRVIEDSVPFKRGKIKLYGDIELDVAETSYVSVSGGCAEPSCADAEESVCGSAESAGVPGSDDASCADAEESVCGSAESAGVRGSDDASCADAEESVCGSAELREVEVTDFDDAKSYLNGELGIPVRRLRTHDAILSEASSHGVVFKGI